MAMLRLARQRQRTDLVAMVVSVRGPADLYYADEVRSPEVTVAYSRQAPEGSARPPGRLGPADLAPLLTRGATAYVCGSSGFSDAATDLLTGLDVPADQIRVERFGPTRVSRHRSRTLRRPRSGPW